MKVVLEVGYRSDNCEAIDGNVEYTSIHRTFGKELRIIAHSRLRYRSFNILRAPCLKHKTPIPHDIFLIVHMFDEQG